MTTDEAIRTQLTGEYALGRIQDGGGRRFLPTVLTPFQCRALVSQFELRDEWREADRAEMARLKGVLDDTIAERDKLEATLEMAVRIAGGEKECGRHVEGNDPYTRALHRFRYLYGQLAVLERDAGQLVEERDEAHGLLDRLVEAVGGAEVAGEHSNTHNPWVYALELVELETSIADENDALRSLLHHYWVHSGRLFRGYEQMTPAQQKLFDEVIKWEDHAANGSEAARDRGESGPKAPANGVSHD